MMTFFRRSGKAVSTAVDVVSDTVEDAMTVHSPLSHIPSVTAEHPASLGDDINLPLLVKELGGRKKLTLSNRRKEILRELEKIDKELLQLDILLEAANKI